MADVCHIKNRFWPSVADFNEILRGQAVFHRISVMGQTPAFHRTFLFSYCTLGFGERHLSYRLRYTCLGYVRQGTYKVQTDRQ